MSNRLTSFDRFVVNGIIANNAFGITLVENLVSIRSACFTPELYETIRRLIQENDLRSIETINEPERREEFLEVMKFEDQDKRSYIVMVYDSLGLSQDPQIIEIFLSAGKKYESESK